MHESADLCMSPGTFSEWVTECNSACISACKLEVWCGWWFRRIHLEECSTLLVL